MKRSAFPFFVFFLLTFTLNAHASLLGIRLGKQENHTRIVFDLSEKVPVESVNDGGLRVILSAGRNSNFKNPREVGIIKEIEVDQDSLRRTKVLFKSSFAVKILKSFWIAPSSSSSHYRYVLDIAKGEDLPNPVLPSFAKKLKIVIIDAGHGGQDPGAVGYRETLEKNVTLAVAKKLAATLNESGHYKAILLRKRDVFMSLASRLKKARALKGDVFISLHADSHPRPDTRGLGVYTLSSVASDKEAERLAQKENKADLIMGIDLKDELPEVSNILIDLTKRETMNLSTKLAQSLVKNLGKYAFLLRNPHRFAGFVVLRSTDLPSVLIELGYISNKKDEELLLSEEYQDKICHGILEGIEAYFHR